MNDCPLVTVDGGAISQETVNADGGAAGVTVTGTIALKPSCPVALFFTCTTYRTVVGAVTVGAISVVGLPMRLAVALLVLVTVPLQHVAAVGSVGSQCTWM